MDIAESYHADELPGVIEEESLDTAWRIILKWSLPGGSVFGVIIRIHFLILLGIALWFSGAGNLSDLLERGKIFFMVTLAVLLHEMAHAFLARYFNNTVEGICLIPPLGGLTFIKLESKRPLNRIIIFISGPFINLLLAALIFFLMKYQVVDFYSFYIRTFIREFFMINLATGIFNLIPLYPLDGGRILKDIFLLCKASKRAAKITTILVSLLCFIAIAPILFMTSSYAFIIILTVLLAVGIGALAIDGDDIISSEVA